MLRALGLALTDLGDRRILAIMLEALGVTLLIFVILGALLFCLFAGADPCALVGADSCPLDAGSSGIGAIVLVLLAGWLLFPAVALGVMMTFTDRIASAVEQRHYPASAAEARSIGIGRGAIMGLRSAGRLLLFNLLALPFYLLLVITGVGPFILFVIVNGIAFGRDLGELAAARHGTSDTRRAWLRSTRGEQHRIGLVVSILFLIPFANLLAPVLGTAAAIHLYNRFSSGGPRPANVSN